MSSHCPLRHQFQGLVNICMYSCDRMILPYQSSLWLKRDWSLLKLMIPPCVHVSISAMLQLQHTRVSTTWCLRYQHSWWYVWFGISITCSHLTLRWIPHPSYSLGRYLSLWASLTFLIGVRKWEVACNQPCHGEMSADLLGWASQSYPMLSCTAHDSRWVSPAWSHRTPDIWVCVVVR